MMVCQQDCPLSIPQSVSETVGTFNQCFEAVEDCQHMQTEASFCQGSAVDQMDYITEKTMVPLLNRAILLLKSIAKECF